MTTHRAIAVLSPELHVTPADHVPAAPPAGVTSDPSGDAADAQRRVALGQFLRARRERLTPTLAGLPHAAGTGGRRRRTPGLRREEVAERAGVSAAWYPWLEQGRDVRPSPATLERLAAALQLPPSDRAYLRTLTFGDAPADAGPADADVVPPSIRGVLDALATFPAYVVDARWELLAWNAAATRVIRDFAAVPAAGRNMLRLTLLDPVLRARLPDWADDAQRAVALFRATTAGYVGEPWYQTLVDDLTRESPEFARWWPALEVRAVHSARKMFAHPTAGRLVVTPVTLYVAETPELRLMVYQPVDGPEGEETRARLLQLARDGEA